MNKLYPNSEGVFSAQSDYINKPAYAANSIDDNDQQRIYQIGSNKKPMPNIFHKHILYTEDKPTQDQIDLLKNQDYTVIYSPQPDLAIVRQNTTRYVTTRTKALYIIMYNKPASVQFTYHNFHIGYPASIGNTQKQLSTHGVRVKLTDLTLNHTMIIEPCSTGTTDYIPDLNWDIYKDTMRPYLSMLRQDEQQLRETNTPKPRILHHSIVDSVNVWAPAYGIETPREPEDSCYNFFNLNMYNMEMLRIYTQLRYYEDNNFDMDPDYTICQDCGLPILTTSDECKWCLTAHEDIWEESAFHQRAALDNLRPYDYINNPIWDDVN